MAFQLYKSHLSDKPITFIPVAIARRSQLPLAWLDPSSDSATAQITPGQLFRADIKSLRNTRSLPDQPAVLTARITPNGGLYAIEQVQDGLYTACRLAPWVKERHLLAMVDGLPGLQSIHPALATTRSGDKKATENSTPKTAPIGTVSAVKKPRLKKGALALMSLLSQKEETTTASLFVVEDHQADTNDASLVPGNSQNIKEEELETSALPKLQSMVDAALPTLENSRVTQVTQVMQSQAPDPEISHSVANEQKSQQSVTEVLRTQYLEALYLSKASVAYFAKGPLSRARLSPHLNSTSDKEPTNLAAFYRESIVPLKKMDLKYRESITTTVQGLPFMAGSDDELDQLPTSQASKRRKSKKRKMGKDGMYPGEEVYVAKWWRNRDHDASLPAPESREAEIKRVIPELRNRETYLQIILILEAMSLEISFPAKAAQTSGPGQNAVEDTDSVKKLLDLNTHLELLLDRLCIWQSVNTDLFLPKTNAEGSSMIQKSGRTTNDKSRDFCMEVIMPFYASRLPEQCKDINRKLGGSSTISPTRTRRPLAKAASMSQVVPGAPIKHPQAQKVRRTLQRVLTDEKMAAQTRPPSLARSTTAPVMPELKRESSEPTLASLRPASRGGIQKPKRLDNREVDLDAVVKQNEAKIKRMKSLIDQKKELDDAINALRKPNRGLVGKDLAETAEKRTADAVSKSARKPKNPIRLAVGQGVQVMATPKKARARFTIGPPTFGGINDIREATELEDREPPSSAMAIPSSTVKPIINVQGYSNPIALPSNKKRSHTIHETPSRGSSKLSNPLNLDLAHDSGIGTSSPALPESSSRLPLQSLVQTHSTPTAQRSYLLPDVQVTPLRMSKSHRQVLLTPIKRIDAVVEDVFARAPMCQVAEDVRGQSIYDSLGWDDDFDEIT